MRYNVKNVCQFYEDFMKVGVEEVIIFDRVTDTKNDIALLKLKSKPRIPSSPSVVLPSSDIYTSHGKYDKLLKNELSPLTKSPSSNFFVNSSVVRCCWQRQTDWRWKMLGVGDVEDWPDPIGGVGGFCESQEEIK